MNEEPILDRAAGDRAEAMLRQGLGRRVQNLRVELRDGGLVLRGWTLSYYDKQMAQQFAMRNLSLPIRGNEIEVRSALAADRGGPEEIGLSSS